MVKLKIQDMQEEKEIIIRISEPFINDNSYHGDEDLSTLGATEVFEAIVIKNTFGWDNQNDRFGSKSESRHRLIGNDAVKHIDDVIIQTTRQYPGKIYSDFREATLIELEESINLLKQFNGVGCSQAAEKLRKKLTQLKRNHTLDKLI